MEGQKKTKMKVDGRSKSGGEEERGEIQKHNIQGTFQDEITSNNNEATEEMIRTRKPNEWENILKDVIRNKIMETEGQTKTKKNVDR